MSKNSLNDTDRPNNFWMKLNKRGPKVTQNRRMQGTSVRLSLRYDGLELSSLMAATLYFLPLHTERKKIKSSKNGKILIEEGKLPGKKSVDMGLSKYLKEMAMPFIL